MDGSEWPICAYSLPVRTGDASEEVIRYGVGIDGGRPHWACKGMEVTLINCVESVGERDC